MQLFNNENTKNTRILLLVFVGILLVVVAVVAGKVLVDSKSWGDDASVPVSVNKKKISNLKENTANVPASADKKDVLNLQTFTSQMAGFTFAFPTFGAQYTVSERPASDGTPGSIEVQLQNIQVPEGPQYQPLFSISFVNNPDQKNLDVWFHDFLDPTGIILSSGWFTRRTLNNGIDAYVLSDSVSMPDGYEGDPVSSLYAVIPSTGMIFCVDGPQDTSLEDFGSSNDKMKEILLDVVESIRY